jgi:hypothetical protein
MKRLMLVIVILVIGIVNGDDQKYVKAMESALAGMNTENVSEENFLNAANKFERIALAEKDKWLPYYYSAYAYTLYSFFSSDNSKKDEILDKAEKYGNIADSLHPDNSEVYVLRSMINSGRLMVDPQGRMMKYGPKSTELLYKARELNVDNPRVYFLLGQSLYFTPAAFGGGKEKAMEMLTTAMEKYEFFTPETELHPNWGKAQAQEMISRINQGQTEPRREPNREE